MCQTAVTATETPTFCPKDRRFSVVDYALKKRKKIYRDLARKNSSTSWIVKLIESTVHEWFFHADGSILFHPCKIWTIKKVERSVHIRSVSIYEFYRLLLLVNKEKTRDRYRHVTIHCRRFSSTHEMTIVDTWSYQYQNRRKTIQNMSIFDRNFISEVLQSIDSLFLYWLDIIDQI